ncbi:hypothetical protein [Kitasatospora sp. A2-31]|uniref:class III lanthionine synthetase LanKC N-terminal domain-containing protein n=1 Tax=Kitasatospora sp. A2-31 TaxID=2916414 RepID=UPI001EE9A8C9|nr:hypothetical protein [Kitasatospora sp. A2-31]MCG6493311.1 hypothetical protein [Kitasatospora sp. A2-31]
MARSALAGAGSRGGDGDWEVTVDGFWCTARPAEGELAGEGWKLHVSAAPAVGGAVLAAVVETLADDPCAFRFAAGQEQLHEMNSRNDERGSAGKFITVYPAGEEQFRRLAAALHLATDGLPGPVILSDRPYRPGSLVHYRYGAFAVRAELGNDGGYRSMLRGPAGERVEDVRGASYRCPPWARDPLRDPTRPAGSDDGPVPGRGGGAGAGAGSDGSTGRPGVGAAGSEAAGRSATGHRPGAARPTAARRGAGGVLLAGRYVITGAVRHSAKGGVFLGRDTDGGAEVVVKQARAHIDVDRAGTDARAALRHEAALLAGLEGHELAPRPVELVEQDDSLFLVQERIAGQPLGSWVAARLRRDSRPDVDWAEAGPMARRLLDLLQRVHELGLVLRDLSPGNVLVQPDGSLRLVDLELAAEAGRRVGSAGTPGYRAPEQGPGRLALVGAAPAGTAAGAGAGAGAGAAAGTGRRVGRPGRVTDGLCVAEPAADRYALGGLFFLLATGHDPLLPEDLPHARPVADRLGRWLALAARSGETARRLAPVVLGLRAEEPELRWGLDRVREALAEAARGDVPRPVAGDAEFRTGAEESAQLIAARSALRDGLLVLPDGTGTGCAAAYGTGTAGALAFLLRLRHGGPRLWVDPVPARPVHRPAAGGTPGTGDLPRGTTGVPSRADDAPAGTAEVRRRPGEDRARTGEVRTT